MNVKINVDLRRVRQIAARMDRRLLEPLLIKGFKEALAPVVEAARAAAPIGTSFRKHLPGRLQRSIALRISTRRGLRIAITAVPYGHLVEFGHRIATGGRLTARVGGRVGGFVNPRPFVQPAVDAAQPMVEQDVAATVEKGLLF